MDDDFLDDFFADYDKPEESITDGFVGIETDHGDYWYDEYGDYLLTVETEEHDT